MTVDAEELRAALEHWTAGEGVEVRPLAGGLIHATFRVDSPAGTFVLQRVHPIFGPGVHEDLAAVTEHLERRGLVTPRLQRTRGGGLFAEVGPERWRMMSFVPGATFAKVRGADQARSAGALIGRFHGALADLSWDFRSVRGGVHDTPAHLRALAAVLDDGQGHRLYDDVARLGARVLARADALPRLEGLPARVVHGDPKLENVRFAADDGPGAAEAVCMLDLDTCARMPLHFELGDAWRSWCNRGTEDDPSSAFDLEIFTASWHGYRTVGAPLEAGEREALIFSVEWIALELCARFLVDSLRETYFGWDATRYPARGEHNLARARGQWSLLESAVALRSARETLLRAG